MRPVRYYVDYEPSRKEETRHWHFSSWRNVQKQIATRYEEYEAEVVEMDRCIVCNDARHLLWPGDARGDLGLRVSGMKWSSI